MKNSRFLSFKIGQAFWLFGISFSSYFSLYSVEANKAPLIATTLLLSAVPIRYFYLSSIQLENWNRGDIERLVDILRELIICSIIYTIVFLPSWWFTKEFYELFGDVHFFSMKNFPETDYQTVKSLNKSYGIMIVVLASTLENWLVFGLTQKHLKE